MKMDKIKGDAIDDNGYAVSQEKQDLLDAINILRRAISRLDKGSAADDYAVSALFHLHDRVASLPLML